MSSNASRRAGLGRWIIAVVVHLRALAVFAPFGVLWYAYVEVMGLGASGPPPLIRAEAGPIKRAPDNPGGMEIPNRDSAAARVFQETATAFAASASCQGRTPRWSSSSRNPRPSRRR